MRKRLIDKHEEELRHERKRDYQTQRNRDGERRDRRRGHGDQRDAYRRSGGAIKQFFASESWAEVGASEALVEALESLSMPKPSHVQAAAYKALRAGVSLPLQLVSYPVASLLHRHCFKHFKG